MRITLVNAGWPGKDIIQLRGFSAVVTWYLARELRMLGHTVNRIWDYWDYYDKDGDKIESADVCILFSGIAIHRTRDSETAFDILAEKHSAVYRIQDGAYRKLLRLKNGTEYFVGENVQFGLGVDPKHCFPEQDAARHPVVIFNAWNKSVQDHGHDRQNIENCFEALRRVKSERKIEIHSVNWPNKSVDFLMCKALGNADKEAVKKARLGYVPWVEWCRYIRRGSVFLDATPKITELGRTEAAACGCETLFPTPPTIEAYRKRTHICPGWWDNENIPNRMLPLDMPVDVVYSEVMQALDRVTPQETHKKVTEYFSWPKAANLLIEGIQKHGS